MTATLTILTVQPELGMMEAELDLDGVKHRYQVGVPEPNTDPQFHALRVLANTLAIDQERRSDVGDRTEEIETIKRMIAAGPVNVTEDWEPLYAATVERNNATLSNHPLIRMLVEKSVFDDADIEKLKMLSEEQ